MRYQNQTDTKRYRSSLRCSITAAQFTAVQKLYQGIAGKRAVYRFPVAFFRSFFSIKKRTIDSFDKLLTSLC